MITYRFKYIRGLQVITYPQLKESGKAVYSNQIIEREKEVLSYKYISIQETDEMKYQSLRVQLRATLKSLNNESTN